MFLFQPKFWRRLLVHTVLLLALATPGLPQPSPIRFTDITAPAGITFRHLVVPEKKYLPESMSGGVAAFDFDNDGWLDLYFLNSLSIELAHQGGQTRSALYRNNHDGTFRDVTDQAGLANVGWGMGVVAGDYNNDGWADLYVTCLGPNHLFKNNGDGTFTDVTASAGVREPRWSTGAAWVDYDRDGWLDLFVANYVDYDLTHLPEFGKGKLCQFKNVAVQCGPRGLRGAGDALFHNNGDGTFSDVSQRAGVADPQGFFGMGVACSDFDGDGWPDLYVANDSTPNFLYHNNGDGTFAEIGFASGAALSQDGAEQGSMGVALGDYDHDGRFDVFVTNFADDYNTLYHNEGRNSFVDVSYRARLAQAGLPYVGWGTKFFDFDNDGWGDLFVANGHVYPQVAPYQQPKLLYRNNRDGTFTELAAQGGPALTASSSARGVAFGDLDNDGDVDLVINALDGAPQLLRNDGGNAQNFVSLRLIGAKSNRDAIGARVRLVAGRTRQVEEVRSGGSYLSANDLRLHFGLGRQARVSLLEIRWPSGKVERLRNVRARRFLTIQEGRGILPATTQPTPQRKG